MCVHAPTWKGNKQTNIVDCTQKKYTKNNFQMIK